MFFFYSYGDHLDLHVLTHSFPTRRSSDRPYRPRPSSRAAFRHGGNRGCYVLDRDESLGMAHRAIDRRHRADADVALTVGGRFRSEEPTSELQSLMRISYAVFCLKKIIIAIVHYRLTCYNGRSLAFT